jgi:hypothetical protein
MISIIRSKYLVIITSGILFLILYNIITIYDYIDNVLYTPKSKICVVMWYDKNIKDYADNFYEINKKYCQLFGYDIIRDSTRRISKRKPHYERIPLIAKILYRYDYVVWIDSDAHFYLDSPPIEIIINKFKDNDFIFSADQDRGVFETVINNGIDKVNTGIFIVKNTNYSLSILKIWAYDNYLFENRINKHSWNDQGVMRLILKNNIQKIQEHSIIIPYGVLQHFEYNGSKNNIFLDKLSIPILSSCKMNKPFVRHMPGITPSKRKYLSYKYIQENNKYFKYYDFSLTN